MTEIALQNRLGVFLVLSHFAILLMVIIFWLLDAFLPEQMTTTVAIMAPFFAAYTTAIIRHVIKTRNQVTARGRRVTSVFAFLAFLTPALFVVVVAGAVVLKAFNIGLASFENFKIMLATAETIFGVYVGQFIFSLFEPADQDRSDPMGGSR